MYFVLNVLNVTCVLEVTRDYHLFVIKIMLGVVDFVPDDLKLPFVIAIRHVLSAPYLCCACF